MIYLFGIIVIALLQMGRMVTTCSADNKKDTLYNIREANEKQIKREKKFYK